MAKARFDWVTDTRRDPQGLASLEDWDLMAAQVPQIIDRSQSDCGPLFAAHASTIYAALEDNGKQSAKAMLLLKRHERLRALLDMHEQSNPIDFYFIKFPAWLASEWLHRREERKHHHV